MAATTIRVGIDIFMGLPLGQFSSKSPWCCLIALGILIKPQSKGGSLSSIIHKCFSSTSRTNFQDSKSNQSEFFDPCQSFVEFG